MSDLIAKRLCAGTLCVLTVLLAGGCALVGDSPGNKAAGNDGRMPGADSDAALGYDQPDWDRAIWDKWIDDARGSARARDAEGSAEVARSADGRARSVPPRVPSTAGDPSGLRQKVGVYIDPQMRDSLTAYRLINALEKRAAAHGLIVLKPSEIDEAVAGSDACASDTPLDCPKLLAIYPGLRALIVIDAQRAGGGEQRIATALVDTEFDVGESRSTTELALRAKNNGPGSDLAIWSERLLSKTADRIAIAPWFAHTFALKDGDFYISAGREAGLEKGATLAVHGEGSLLHSPAGHVVAWEPGPEIGRVRVKRLVGRNVALAEKLSGDRPTPKNRLTPVD